MSLLCSHSSVRPLTEQRYYESVRLSGSAWSHRAEEEEGLQNLPPKKPEQACMFDTRQPACVQTPGSVVFASPLETVALLRSGGEGMEEKKKRSETDRSESRLSCPPSLSLFLSFLLSSPQLFISRRSVKLTDFTRFGACELCFFLSSGNQRRA